MDRGDRNQVTCIGHEELRDIALGTRNDVKHLTETVSQALKKMEDHEARIRDLEIHGAKISQDNASELEKMQCRVSDLEEFKGGHESAQKEASKIAAIIAGTISIAGVITGIVVSLWFWGKP